MKLSDATGNLRLIAHYHAISEDTAQDLFEIADAAEAKARKLEIAIQESDQRYSDLQDLHLEALQCNLKLDAENERLVRYVRAYRNSAASEAIEAYEALSQELRDEIEDV